mmetsp:Transcript_89560/g.253846  ORF Transcript_89560/g.253846 Transcript_89560/m.253846 type:complete len:551 (-) Transcript_89560:77-1729(-)
MVPFSPASRGDGGDSPAPARGRTSSSSSSGAAPPDAPGGSDSRAAAAGEPLEDAPIVVGRPVGLPNRGNDCFWLCALQCLRHTPGFAAALAVGQRRLPSGPQQPGPPRLLRALLGLFQAMERVESEGSVSLDDKALSQFRLQAHEVLPASDSDRTLVQQDLAEQRQQDTHEFLSQLLDCLGGIPPGGDEPLSPRMPVQPSRLEVLEKELTAAAGVRVAEKVTQCPQGHQLQPWAAHAGTCDGCFRRIRTGEKVMDCRECDWYLCESCHSVDKEDPEVERAIANIDNLLYEYSMVQWAASTTRMRSRALGAIFEGQRLASVRCQGCQRYGASGAEPFTVEEVKVSVAPRDANSWFAPLADLLPTVLGGPPKPPSKATLGELLRDGAESPAAEGYLCPNPACARVGSNTRSMHFLRLSAVLVLHVNRVQSDGQRCEIPLEFEPTLDLGELDLVAHFGSPLDYHLEVCMTRYNLISAVFHRGRTERSGHYFTYILHAGVWMRVDDDKVTQPDLEAEATPMALELSEPAGGARVALLFYQREGAFTTDGKPPGG